MTPTSQYVLALFDDANIVGLRHQTPDRWTTSWHTDPDDLIFDAIRRKDTGNLFTTLNYIPPGQPLPPHPTKEPFTRYTRIFVDLDPRREQGQASTAQELQAAQDRCDNVRAHLHAHGWPAPAVGMSGNGAHLMYRTALPASSETDRQLRSIYRGIDQRYSDDRVDVDVSVRSINRVAPLYGSVKRKGPGIGERPHRQTHITIPLQWRQVRRRSIDRLAALYDSELTVEQARITAQALRAAAESGHSQGDFKTLDLVGLFAARQHYIKHIADNVHAVICPWRHEHSGAGQARNDTIIFSIDGAGGWPGFFCHHAHCEGRNLFSVAEIWPEIHAFCSKGFGK